jgi:hypothetical protein
MKWDQKHKIVVFGSDTCLLSSEQILENAEK